jgi:hypothetical protein
MELDNKKRVKYIIIIGILLLVMLYLSTKISIIANIEDKVINGTDNSSIEQNLTVEDNLSINDNLSIEDNISIEQNITEDFINVTQNVTIN